MKWKACIATLIIFTLFFTGTVSVPAASFKPRQESRIVTVGISEVPGISETDEFGNRTGVLIDYLDEIAKYTNWEYRFIDLPSEEIIPEFLEGKFDLMGGTYYAPEFEEYFSYPEFSMGTDYGVLYCRQDDWSIKSYELSSLNGKTIGVYEMARDKVQRLKDFLKLNRLDCRLVYYSYNDMGEENNLYRFLKNGDVDLLLGSETEFADTFRIAAEFAAQPYYIVTQPGNGELLEELNRALEYIMDSDPFFAEYHYEKNFQNLGTANVPLNHEELRFIEDKQTVTVAMVENWHPFYCENPAVSYHKGIVPELLNMMSDSSGLSFEYALADTYEEAIDMVKEGSADILGYYLDSERAAASEGLVLSKSYISLNNIIVKNKGVSYPSQGLTVGLLKGRPMPRELKIQQVRYYDTTEQCLDAVNRGQVDIIYGLSSTIEQEMQNRRYNNVMPITSTNESIEVTFAMDRPANISLLTILNKTITNLSPEQRASLLDHNLLSISSPHMTISQLIYANPLAFLSVVTLFILLAASAVIMIMRVKMKNAIIQSELTEAEAKNKAKTDFLSRMSHEIRTPMNAIVGLAELTCMEKDLSKPVENNVKRIISSSRYLLSLINDILDMARIESGKLEIGSEPLSLSELSGDLETMMRTQAQEKQIAFTCTIDITHECITGDPLRLRQVLVNLLSNAMKFTPENGRVTLTIKELNFEDEAATYMFSVKDTGTGIPAESLDRIFESFEQLGPSSAKSAGTGLGLPISSSIVKAMGSKLRVKSAPGKGSEFYFRLCCRLGVKESPPPSHHVKLENLQGIKLLVAEDNDLNAEIARELMILKGAQVDRACNGKEALDMFESSAPGTYQAVLMDIRMPVMDGLEATRAIRSSPHPESSTIPIIAMTANSFKEDSDSAREAGMNGFIPKPVDLEYLFEVLGQCIT